MSIPQYALSIKQPWAWAIIHGGKDVENRVSQQLCRRGVKIEHFAAHASKNMTRQEYKDGREFMMNLGVICPTPDQLIYGGVIGDVHVSSAVIHGSSQWFMGPYGMRLFNPKACTPIPVKGQLGFFKWTPKGQIDAPKPWMKSYNYIGEAQ